MVVAVVMLRRKPGRTRKRERYVPMIGLFGKVQLAEKSRGREATGLGKRRDAPAADES
jgi:hypothetical protein